MTVQQHGCTSLYLLHDRAYIDLDITLSSGTMRKARFLVDTGGKALVFTEAFARDLGMVQDRRRSVPGLALTYQRVTRKPQMSIGTYALDLRGVTAWIAPANYARFYGDGVDGTLPGIVLSRYYVTLDYPQQEFSIAPREAAGPATSHGEPVPVTFSPQSRLPRIEVNIAGERLGMLLDTGASCSMISERLLETWSERYPQWPQASGAVGTANVGATGDAFARMVRIPYIIVGSLLVKMVVAVSRPAEIFDERLSGQHLDPIVGVLAGNVLKQFRIEIDYQHSMSYWERLGSSYPYDMDMVGLTLAPHRDGTYSIAVVSDGNHFRVRQAVQVGDRLLQVDGLVVKGQPLSKVVAALKGSPGQRCTLLLERDGELRCVSVLTARIL
ncbi:aspartyl protease family protein [Dictyobacter arantiisoli]|uniref:PDZ domain-containing protein n=1 Tax=Dictyobacter arantiisoli TaxID=2014874 RepID=A0A5A5TK33_9CHLR|nr:aspartyl protease family protein [Dictyobacter arantiisoli]GCF11389.1 hypothetical protein KDI_49530 [Dictyobacter arantiisoli]